MRFRRDEGRWTYNLDRGGPRDEDARLPLSQKRPA